MIRPLIAALALSACAAPDVSTRAHTVRNDNGGSIAEYIARAERLRGQPVVIAGTCHSACAVLASLPTACLGPSARVGLHWPYLLVNGAVLGPDVSSAWFRYVTPQIAATVRALPFDYARANELQITVTAASAAQYGLKVCE
jgi:hypothetical protein